MALIDSHGSVPHPADSNARAGSGLQPLPLAALEQLSSIHAEHAQAAQRMAFLQSTANAALALLLLGVAALVFGAGTSLRLCFTWSLLVLLGICALLRCHIRSTASDRASVGEAVKDLRAILLYAGFAWGTGALLVLPAATGAVAAVLFTVTPGIAMALLLRDQSGTLAFLVPLTAISILAAILRPWPDAGLDTALLLMLQSGIAACVILRNRRPEKIPAGLALRS